MTIGVDGFLRIGKHDICEDYILYGIDPFPYVILSDGCSTSKHTDIGSRILCHVALNVLKQHIFNITEFGDQVIEKSKNIVNQLLIKDECLNATLMIMFQIKDIIKIFVYGDGNIIYELNDSEKKNININITFENNAPYYLSYWNDKSKRDDYFGKFEGRKTISNSMFTLVNKDCYEISFDVDSIRKIFIASDGIETIVSKSGEKKPLDEIIPILTNFKSINGEFIKRRIIRALKDLQKENFINFDDISIGGFNCHAEVQTT